MQVEALGRFWEAFVAGIHLPNGLVDRALDALHTPFVARFSAAMLMLLAAASVLWFVTRRIWPAHRMIVMAAKAVEGTADPAAFTASFPRFDRAVNEIALLRRAWAQFRIGIIIPPQSARAPIRHHLRAGDYLHLEALEAGGFTFRLFQIWPKFFLGIGILLSSLYIVLDFHRTSIAFRTDPLAWNGFLLNLSYNVMPLLAGMFSGLALALAFYWSEARLKGDLLQLSQALEQRIKFSMARPYTEQHLQLTGAAGEVPLATQELSLLPEQLRSLSAEIVAALSRIETQMTQTMPGRIGDAMAPLSEALDLLGKRLSESNAEALRQAVGELSQGLHARAVEDLGALSTAMAQARIGLEEAGLALRDASTHASERLSDAGEALAEQLGRASEHAQQAFGPLPLRAAEFGDVLERFNDGLSKQENAIASIAETAHRAISLMDEILSRSRDHTASPVYGGPAHAASQHPQPLLELMAVEDLTRAARDMASSLETVQDARRLMKSLSRCLHQPATSLIAENWAQHREILSDPDETLNEVLENFRTSATQQRASLDTVIEQLEARMERLFRDLDAGAARLDTALHSFRRHALIAAVPQTSAAPDADEGADAA